MAANPSGEATQSVLERASVNSLQNVPVPDSKQVIDHLVLTDRVLAISSKDWEGKFTVSENGVPKLDGKSVTQNVEKATWAERVIRKQLVGTSLEAHEPETVLCLTEADWQADVPWLQFRWVWVVPLKNLLEFLTKNKFDSSPVFDDARAVRVVKSVFDGDIEALVEERLAEKKRRAYQPAHAA